MQTDLNLPFASSSNGAVIWGSSCCCCCCRASATLAAAEADDTRTDRVESPMAIHNTPMLLQTSAHQQTQSSLDTVHADIQPRPQALWSRCTHACCCHDCITQASPKQTTINQSICISCLYDSSGESTDEDCENNIHKALNVQGALMFKVHNAHSTPAHARVT